MHGYDTLQGARGQDGLPDLRVPWDRLTPTLYPDGSSSTYGLCLLDGVQLVYRDRRDASGTVFSELRFQSSLPKILWGNNAEELVDGSDMVGALGKVCDVVSAATGRDEDVTAWTARRVDVPANLRMASEAHVAATLERLSFVKIRGRLGMRGQEGTVSWPAKRGSVTRKFYSKYVESGIEASKGVLRCEAGAIGQQAVKHVWGKAVAGGQSAGGVRLTRFNAIPPIPEVNCPPAPSIVTVGDLISPGAVAVRDRLAEYVLRVVRPLAKEVEELEAMKAFWAFKSDGRRSDFAMRMLGYAWVVQRLGWGFLEDQLSRQGVWKVRKEFERVGIHPEDIEFGQVSPAVGLQELARSGGAQIAGKAAELLDEEFPLEGDEDEEG